MPPAAVVIADAEMRQLAPSVDVPGTVISRFDSRLGNEAIFMHEITAAASSLNMAVLHQCLTDGGVVTASFRELVEQTTTFLEHLRKRVELITAAKALDVFEA